MARIDIDGISFHHRFDGPEHGEVVMLSNSLASNLAMWDPQIPALTRAGYRVLRYDTRGHGATSVPEGPYDIETLTEDAVALMDALDLDSVHFCGLSMGGMTGQMLGTRHPGRLKSLTLAATAPHMAPTSVWEERIEAVRAGGMGAVVDATIDRWFTKPGQTRLVDEVDTVREMILATPVDGFCACCQAIVAMDQRETIRAITAPTRVIAGEEDPGATPEIARFMHERIGGSDLVVVPEAAHFVNVEQAGAFDEALLGHLARA